MTLSVLICGIYLVVAILLYVILEQLGFFHEDFKIKDFFKK